jgi:hypothetical protein
MTALSTAKSGYIQRKIVKVCEDIQVQYDRTVRDATGKLYQYAYGENNYDATKTVLVNGVPQICDIKRLADRLNMSFEEGFEIPEIQTEPEIKTEIIEENKQETKEKKKIIDKIIELVPNSVVDETWDIETLQKRLDTLELEDAEEELEDEEDASKEDSDDGEGTEQETEEEEEESEDEEEESEDESDDSEDYDGEEGGYGGDDGDYDVGGDDD